MKANRVGRPLGESAQAILRYVAHTPAPLPVLAEALQLSYATVQTNVKRLQVAGRVRYGVQVAGAHDRPARVVEPATGATSTAHLQALHRALTGRSS